MQVIKFHPANHFYADITGESGCATCDIEPLRHKNPDSLIKEGQLAICSVCLETMFYVGAEGELRKASTSDGGWTHELEGQDKKCPSRIPCLNFIPKKSQTIRPKPIEVGTKVALWEMFRGMKRGWYCVECVGCICSKIEDCDFSDGHVLKGMCKGKGAVFPRKLMNAEITECVSIEMRVPDNHDDNFMMTISVNGLELFIPYDDEQCAFVKADTPSWTNRQFIDFFLKTYPAICKEWVKFWIWKWSHKEG